MVSKIQSTFFHYEFFFQDFFLVISCWTTIESLIYCDQKFYSFKWWPNLVNTFPQWIFLLGPLVTRLQLGCQLVNIVTKNLGHSSGNQNLINIFSKWFFFYFFFLWLWSLNLCKISIMEKYILLVKHIVDIWHIKIWRYVYKKL